jgi:hypothetical protein
MRVTLSSTLASFRRKHVGARQMVWSLILIARWLDYQGEGVRLNLLKNECLMVK